MEQLAIKPDFRAISEFDQRWLAYREGPFAYACLESICEDARARSAVFKEAAKGKDLFTRQLAECVSGRWFELSLAAAAACDDLAGHEVDGGVDAFEALLWEGQ